MSGHRTYMLDYEAPNATFRTPRLQGTPSKRGDGQMIKAVAEACMVVTVIGHA